MRINAVRSPILVFAALTAVFVPLMTSSHAALGLGVRDSASPSASDSASPVPASSAQPAPVRQRPKPAPTPKPAPKPTPTGSGKAGHAPSIAAQGAFYRSVLDLRPDMPGISAQQYYYIGQAFCTSADLGDDELGQIQQAYAMPANSLAYDSSMADMILQTAPMEFVQENQVAFGFDGSEIDTSTLNAFRKKLCVNHPLWRAYARFVRTQLETLGPWGTDPSFAGDPNQTSQMWNDDLSAWESALGPWLPQRMQAS
ncbi:hypothetical protein [Actinospica sp.]|jgi:hypothetical protein|uniref:hypothetical protein n=1 Tax=Actinospica sp. TaxID=1872142 RepID=UPI002C942B66|nr:hypothetical protein [Actinospica sp.]HWG22586.1 hypothetical protein [Actinospica sp.]